MSIIAEPILTFFPRFKWRPSIKMACVASPERPLELEQGGALSEVLVAYETYGYLAGKKDNAILITHALTGDSHPSAHDERDEKGWWDALIGAGRPLDTERFFIICANVLGGCQGTTGPASLDPATGQPYGMRFPVITIRDMVRVQKRLLEILGIDHLLLVLGGSMGGMQAMEWAVTYPEYMDGVMSIAASGYLSTQAVACNSIARKAIMLDPAWQGGDYYGTAGPADGLAVARSLGAVMYQNESQLLGKSGPKMRRDRFEIEHYLDFIGNNLVKSFDANSYLFLLKALDFYDLAAGYPSYEAALSRIQAQVLTVGICSDILYPPSQQRAFVDAMHRAGVLADYAEIDSLHGHDGFLLDYHLLRPILTGFVNTLATKRTLYRKSF